MFNPHSEAHLTRLQQAITSSVSQMRTFLDNRKEAYQQYVGKNGTQARVPLPMIAQAVSIILRALISSEPQALVTSRQSNTRASSYGFELAINRVLADMDFGRSMKTWAFEAMMAPFGVMQVALDVKESEEMDGMQAWTGRPVASPVLFDDWVHDMSARQIDKIGFCGHRYSIGKEEAITGGLYDPDVVEKIARSDKTDEYSTHKLSRDRSPYEEDYEETIEVWDMYLPREGLVLTLSRDHQGLPPLRVVEWNGPKEGPYHFLWFDDVPGNTMPLPPVALWRDLHELANALFNKLARQAMRQKKMLGVPAASIKDGKLVVAGQDGEAIVMENPGDIQEFATGGIDQSNFAFVLQLKQLHSYFAGNIDVLGGLAAQSGTVGQDQLLSEAAAGRVKSMQESVDKRTAQVMRAVARFMLSGNESVPIVKQVPGLEGGLNTDWTSWDMQGDPLAYDVDIIPHSLRRKSPEERLNAMYQYVTQVLIPLAPMMQAQGQVINTEALHKLASRLMNMPELSDLVIFTQGQMMPSDEHASPAPTATTRNYVRSSRTEKTPQGQESQLIAKLLGQGNAEAA
jgi:hypothetical protein